MASPCLDFSSLLALHLATHCARLYACCAEVAGIHAFTASKVHLVKPLLAALQMGDGGNVEGLYQTYVDTPGLCPYNQTTAKSSVASYQARNM